MTSGVGPEHAHGGYMSRDDNQQYLVDALPMEVEEAQGTLATCRAVW